MIEHTGLIVYLFSFIGLSLIIIDKNSFMILKVNTRKEYDSFNKKNYNELDYNILSISKKLFVLFIIMIMISVFSPTRNQLLTFISTQSTIKTFKKNNILTSKNLIKMKKIIDNKLKLIKN